MGGARLENSLDWIADRLAMGFSQSLDAMTGQSSKATWARVGDPPPADQEMTWWEFRFTGLPEGGDGARLSIGAPASLWQGLGELALRAAGVDVSEPEDCVSTCSEILSQTTGAVAQSLTSRFGREIGVEQAARGKRTSADGTLVSMEVAIADGSKFSILATFTAALLAQLDPTGEEPAEQRPDRGRGEKCLDPGQPAQTAWSPPPSVEKSKTLALLLEVELPVSVSFGRAQLPLRDVLKLSSGSIVELNRSVTEPDEVIVNNCVIARGEVVVVEGNYGVRINQIISREERLRTLH